MAAALVHSDSTKDLVFILVRTCSAEGIDRALVHRGSTKGLCFNHIHGGVANSVRFLLVNLNARKLDVSELKDKNWLKTFSAVKYHKLV